MCAEEASWLLGCESRGGLGLRGESRQGPASLLRSRRRQSSALRLYSSSLSAKRLPRSEGAAVFSRLARNLRHLRSFSSANLWNLPG